MASAAYGEGTDLARRWATARHDERWDGQVADVLAACRAHAHVGKLVQEATTSSTTNRQRMRYPEHTSARVG